MTQDVPVPQNQAGDKQVFLAVIKRECPTCVTVLPALREIEAKGRKLEVYVQDDVGVATGFTDVRDDTSLAASYRHAIETVPTLVRLADGREDMRAVGWQREDWQAITGIEGLGAGLPAFRPGCGSLTMDPGMPARLKVKYGNTGLASRRIELAPLADPVEACYERGWSDGLPVVPPTEERVLEMLDGTARSPREVIGLDSAESRRMHGREGRDQRGDGGLPAGIYAGGAHCHRNRVDAGFGSTVFLPRPMPARRWSWSMVRSRARSA